MSAAESERDDLSRPQCPESPAYDQIISTAIYNIYDPNSLGDWRGLRHKFDCRIKSKADAVKFGTEALKEAHDPFTRLDPPAEVANSDLREDGHEVSFGGRFRTWDDSTGKSGSTKAHNRKMYVEEVFPNSPLEIAGIQIGDRIDSINGKPVAAMSESKVDELLNRSAENRQMQEMVVDHDGTKRKVHMTATDFDTPAVTAREYPNGITYLRVSNFESKKLPEEMQKMLEQHAASRAFVLDLRGNPGGFVRTAFETAQLFVDKGEFSTTVCREFSIPTAPKYRAWSWIIEKDSALELNKHNIPQNKIAFSELNLGTDSGDTPSREPRRPNLLGERPLAILVSDHTASAAETFTDALRTLGNATVIGEQTYGKGVVQSDFGDMPGDTSVHLTTGRLRTASGKYLGNGNDDRHGVIPDIYVPIDAKVVRTTSGDAAFNKALEISAK